MGAGEGAANSVERGSAFRWVPGGPTGEVAPALPAGDADSARRMGLRGGSHSVLTFTLSLSSSRPLLAPRGPSLTGNSGGLHGHRGGCLQPVPAERQRPHSLRETSNPHLTPQREELKAHSLTSDYPPPHFCLPGRTCGLLSLPSPCAPSSGKRTVGGCPRALPQPAPNIFTPFPLPERLFPTSFTGLIRTQP